MAHDHLMCGDHGAESRLLIRSGWPTSLPPVEPLLDLGQRLVPDASEAQDEGHPKSNRPADQGADDDRGGRSLGAPRNEGAEDAPANEPDHHKSLHRHLQPSSLSNLVEPHLQLGSPQPGPGRTAHLTAESGAPWLDGTAAGEGRGPVANFLGLRGGAVKGAV
jgi:hypothetical protein